MSKSKARRAPTRRPMQSVLIANRGEIAMRILRTCKEMGLRGIAVYSDADKDAPVVREADLALRLGPGPAAESYLNVERLLAIAQGNGVDAIHPGYGFLSENAAFSAACAELGICFIGPPPQAIQAMGDKAEAKRLMRESGVPVVPGREPRSQQHKALAKAAEELGYPLLVKAVAGGGGRGIRLVEREADFADAAAAARREATAGFGDGRIMLEKYLANPRHVEFQIMADGQGNVLHLFERECSVQRRRQKIVEETPSPALRPDLREAMGEAALRAARAIAYVGAGTVEFLLDGERNFYFMEMNTRLQVEHPITEMTLGLDLVRLQIEVAQGLPLTLRQEELRPSGHAIECRLTAERPARGFLPATGNLLRFAFPSGPGLRVDTGYCEGAQVGAYYDNLLAKLVTWGPNRGEALRKMTGMLAGSTVHGVDSNLSFLQAVLARPEFASGAYGTTFVEQFEQELVAPRLTPGLTRELLLAAAAVDALLETGRADAQDGYATGAVGYGTAPAGNNRAPAGKNRAPASPWEAGTPWAAATGAEASFRREYELHGARHEVQVQLLHNDGEGLRLRINCQGLDQRLLCIPAGAGHCILDLEEARIPLQWSAEGEARWLSMRGVHARLSSHNPQHGGVDGETGPEVRGKLLAPLPGTVIRVMVKKGQRVAANDLLAIVEAVKMEHQITAPYAGTVGAVHFKEGDPVNKDDLLLDLEPER
ncbi:MAG: ATP-grasp domain-containing protein [SAR324 cluster bacterium]|nr:ATP-grasp domain-containing protein [SAR324 cluster bacterium]